MKKILIVLMFILIGIPFACKDKGDWAKPKSGEWVLNIDSCKIIFTVSPDGEEITELITTFSNFDCGGSLSASLKGTVEISQQPTGWIISENKFKIETDIFSSVTLVLTGTFNKDGNKASGECTVNMYGYICSSNWTSENI